MKSGYYHMAYNINPGGEKEEISYGVEYKGVRIINALPSYLRNANYRRNTSR